MTPKGWRKMRTSTYSSPIREEAPFNSPHLILVNAHNPRDRSLSSSQSYRNGSLGREGTLPEVTQVARGAPEPRSIRLQVFAGSTVTPNPGLTLGSEHPELLLSQGLESWLPPGKPATPALSHIPQPHNRHNHHLCSKSSVKPGLAGLPGRSRS